MKTRSVLNPNSLEQGKEFNCIYYVFGLQKHQLECNEFLCEDYA